MNVTHPSLTVEREARTRPDASDGSANRSAGPILTVGAVTMLVGAAVWASTGADLWAALETRDLPAYLADVAGNEPAHYLNLSLWTLGALLLGLGGAALAARGQGLSANLARAAYPLGAALAIPAFVLMGAVVRMAGQGAEVASLAEAMGFAGARLDDVATILLIGAGPVLLALSGRKVWMPAWLVRWGWLCGAAGAVAAVSIFFGASGTWGMVIVPVGIAWTVAAGVTAARRPVAAA